MSLKTQDIDFFKSWSIQTPLLTIIVKVCPWLWQIELLCGWNWKILKRLKWICYGFSKWETTQKTHCTKFIKDWELYCKNYKKLGCKSLNFFFWCRFWYISTLCYGLWILSQKWRTQIMSLEKNIFWSTLISKSRGGKFFEFLHCLFEGNSDMRHKIQPKWPIGRYHLADGSKGQCRNSIFSSPAFT